MVRNTAVIGGRSPARRPLPVSPSRGMHRKLRRAVTVAIPGPVMTTSPFGKAGRANALAVTTTRMLKSHGGSPGFPRVLVMSVTVPPGTAGVASAGPPTSSRAERLASGTVMTRRNITRDFSRFVGVLIGATIVTEVNIAIYAARSEPTRDRVATGVSRLPTWRAKVAHTVLISRRTAR